MAQQTILILTNSIDGTSDILIEICEAQGATIFRWNVDLWSFYEIVCTEENFRIIDPTGRCVDLTDKDTFLLWRKPFTDLATFENAELSNADREFGKNQLNYFLQSLVAFALHNKRIRLIEPYADRRLPKLFQLILARNFFKVPQSEFSVLKSSRSFSAKTTVCKSIGEPSVGEKIFYTRAICPNDLCRPYPWFIQEGIIEGKDVTCVFINGECHFYECEFERHSNSIDWRVEINTENQSIWKTLKHEKMTAWTHMVQKFMSVANLHYGRIDFLLNENDDLFFLECNTNGQFGWLDDEVDFRLHKKFLASVLNEKTTVVK